MTDVVNKAMTPFGDRVVVMVTAETQQRASQLFLPQGARVRYDAPLMARVVDCGPAVREVRPGMEVLIVAHHDGVEVTVPGAGTYRIIGERAVLAVLVEVPELSDDELIDRARTASHAAVERLRKVSLSDPARAGRMRDLMFPMFTDYAPLTPDLDVKLGLN